MELKAIKFGAIALLATAMTSCALDEDFRELETNATSDSNNNTSEIGFRVQTSQLTRATGSYSNSFRPTQFEITAFDGADNYYNGRTDLVTSADKGNTWTSDHRRYWPTDRNDAWDGLTFYAYIDGNENSWTRGTRSATGKFDITGATPVIRDFVVDSDVHAQRDLMYAVAKDVKNGSNGKVSLNFRHALSQISFTAQNCNPGLEDIEILSIELGGVKGAGTYHYPNATTEGGVAVELRTANTGRWILDTNAGEQSYLLSDLNVHLGAAIHDGKGDMKNISIPTKSNGMIDDSKAMFLIPQAAAARVDKDAASGCYLKVTIKKTQKDAVEASAPEEIFLPVSANWEEGRAYTYNITWRASVINFSVSVSDYAEVG